MRARHLFITAGLLLGTASFTPSLAAAYLSLKPTEAWNVQSFPVEKSGDIPFCTLDKAFGSYRLLFSLNKDYPSKIIMTVPVETYSEAKKYDLRLITDTKTDKKFSALVPTGGYFEMKIEKDDPVFDALRSASSVKFLINNTLVEFQTADLPQAMENLNTCVNNVSPQTTASVQPAPVAAIAEAEPAPVDMWPDVQEVRPAPAPVIAAIAPRVAPVPTLETSPPVIEPSAAPASVDDYLETKKAVMETAPAEPVQNLTSADRDLLKSLKRKVTLLEAEKESLRTKLAQVQPAAFSAPAENDAVCTGKLSALETQVQDMQSAMKTAQAVQAQCRATPVENVTEQSTNGAQTVTVAASQIIPLNKQIDSLSVENKSLAKQLKAAKAAPVEKVAAEPVSNTAEMEKLSQSLQVANEKTKALTQKLAEVQAENLKLLEKVGTSPAQPVAAIPASDPVASDKITTLEQEIARLQQENKQLAEANQKAATPPVCPAPIMDEKVKAELSVLRAEHDAYVELLQKCQN